LELAERHQMRFDERSLDQLLPTEGLGQCGRISTISTYRRCWRIERMLLAECVQLQCSSAIAATWCIRAQ
jgi:hypothetical protein